MNLSPVTTAWVTFTDAMHSIEPGFVQTLPAIPRALLIYSAINITLVIATGSIFLLIHLTTYPLFRLLDRVSRTADYSHMTDLAKLYVALEIPLTTIGIPAPSVLQEPPPTPPTPEKNLSDAWLRLARSSLKSPVKHAAYRAAQLLAMLFYITITAAKEIVRLFVPTRLSRIIAWLLTLGYLEILSAIWAFFGRLPLREITLPQVVAGLTVLVLIYALVGSDVRGRAELNKNASYECRKILHRCQPLMIEMAKALARIRRLSTRQLDYYPSNSAVMQLTGRSDLASRGSWIAPYDTSTSDLRLWELARIRNRRLDTPLTIRTNHPKLLTDKHADEIVSIYTAIKEELYTKIDNYLAIVKELDQSGFRFKLHRVLHNGPAWAFNYLNKYECGRRTAEESILPAHALSFDTNIAHIWISDPDYWTHLKDEPCTSWQLLDACWHLSSVLHQVASDLRTRQWQLAIAEQYLYSLSRTISRALHPTALERLRQAIGK